MRFKRRQSIRTKAPIQFDGVAEVVNWQVLYFLFACSLLFWLPVAIYFGDIDDLVWWHRTRLREGVWIFRFM